MRERAKLWRPRLLRPLVLEVVLAVATCCLIGGCWLARESDGCSGDGDCPDGQVCFNNRGVKVCTFDWLGECLDAGRTHAGCLAEADGGADAGSDGELDTGHDREDDSAVADADSGDRDVGVDAGDTGVDSDAATDLSGDPADTTDAAGGGEGDPCASPANCSEAAPICSNRTNECQDGSDGDACWDGDDCSIEAPICGPSNACQDGSPADACISADHCAAGSSICGPAGCQAGVEGDPCIGPAQCGGSAPICEPSGFCQDGSDGDPCRSDGQCGAGSPICGPAGCQAGSAGDSCVDDDDCAGSPLSCSNEYCARVPAGFVYIPAGTSWMGSPGGCPGPEGYPGDCTAELVRESDEGPLHETTLTSPFYLATREVTQGEWLDLMGNNPSSFSDGGSGASCGNDCPVETVDWWEAIEYLNRLSDAEGLDRCYTLTGCTNAPGEDMQCTAITVDATDENPYLCEGYRLPTEAEWEYANRAGSVAAFYNGDIEETGCDRDPNLDAIGWYCSNASSTTHPVARKAPNAWGLYDMSGNVWEWVWDWYGFYSSSPPADPRGPPVGLDRVFRGGAWGNNAEHCRAANRGHTAPGARTSILGFRPARSGP